MRSAVGVTALLALLSGLAPGSVESQVSPTTLVPVAHRAVPSEVDGQVDFRPDGSWLPLLAVEWDERSARTEAWLRAEWSRLGLYLALYLPNAREEVRMGAGRAPPTPFQVVAEIAGGAGPWTVRCVPLAEPVTTMTRRLHAYLFNLRPGSNARPGESGHVLCHEISLLGIMADSMRTRWMPAEDGGLQFEATIPWQTLRLPAPAPGTRLSFSLHVDQPGDRDVRLAPAELHLRSDDQVTIARPILTPGVSVRQPDPLLAAYPASGAEHGDALQFTLHGPGGRESAAGAAGAAGDGFRAGDAVFVELPTEGLPDGRYSLRVQGPGGVGADHAVWLVGDRSAEHAREHARLSRRLDRLGERELTPLLGGHLERGRRILDLATLEQHPDSAALARSTGLLADARALAQALEDGRRPSRDLEGFDHPAGFSLDGRRGPVSFVPWGRESARLTVHGDRRADWSLTERLYGTFSEPVVYDRPIYSYLYAQQLRNPSFEFGHPTAEETARAFIRYDELEPEAARAALDGEWIPRLDAGVEEVAAPWIGVGRGPAAFTVECAALNDRQCQRIRMDGAGSAGVGQVIELPAWRTTGYRLRTFLRSDGSVTGARAVLYHEGRAVDSVTFEGITTEWKEFNGVLESVEIEAPENAFLLALLFEGPGSLDVDLTTLYPDDAVEGFDPQAVAQLEALNTGWIRWPGGNYASGYRWRDGVGPPDLRPSTPNPSWPGLNPNLVGTDEILQLAERLGFDVMITVNAGSGTAEEAAQWVEYVNGDTSTVLGRLRARNGHPEPYGVRYWNIGNELWGHWQVGYTNPEEYARRYAAFVQAIRAVDPTVSIIANAHGGHSESPPGPWNRPLLQTYPEKLEAMDIHTYVGVPNDQGHSPSEQAFFLAGIPLSYEQWIAGFRDDLVGLGLEDVDVIVGEYNASIRSESSAMNRVADLLAYAGYLHTFMRQGQYVTGANATEYSVFDPRGAPFGRLHPRYDLFRIYAGHAGTRPVDVTVETPVRHQPYRVGRDVLPMFNIPLVDGLALLDPSDGSLGVSLINRDMSDSISVQIALDAFDARPRGRLFVFRGDGTAVDERPVDVEAPFSLTLPPHSVSLLKLYPAGGRPAGEADPGARFDRRWQ